MARYVRRTAPGAPCIALTCRRVHACGFGHAIRDTSHERNTGEDTMSNLLRLRATLVALPLIAWGAAAQAQTIAPSSPAPMAKTPMAASGAASAANPDNMPMKKPTKRADDRMMRSDPASDAKAK
jgi:hypothetical protein